ncbi:Cu(I)-responsive transcriptional regulator [Lacimicrobium alkaliphilum]|uniref:Cu(I)-responsive transcriptional regulator n=1 Tax=Lacimicrobium alkaliphilum TaxID=1526571 RepID=A0ABQ1R924_9ALTE|nr:Cu(I)-responsive transcriptional regulator [Lacimicrobium alkaliphilum]GGD58273.1 Cu(I)-responsive transcriptional regulator [Lacimicrobium alkaliphilum]
MNIGEAAQRTGLSNKMIRHYEAQGLFTPAGRSEAGYRLYSEQNIQVLCFIRQARRLDFSIAQIAGLLQLWQNPQRSSRDVKEMAEAHLAEVDQKLRELKSMKTTLESMIKACKGNDDPACAILSKLENPIE